MKSFAQWNQWFGTRTESTGCTASAGCCVNCRTGPPCHRAPRFRMTVVSLKSRCWNSVFIVFWLIHERLHFLRLGKIYYWFVEVLKLLLVNLGGWSWHLSQKSLSSLVGLSDFKNKWGVKYRRRIVEGQLGELAQKGALWNQKLQVN